MVYIEKASNPREAALNGFGDDETVFHIPDNGRDTVIMLPAKSAQRSVTQTSVVGGEIATP